MAPVWSADGSVVFYAASRGGRFELWSRDASAAAPATPLNGAVGAGRHVFPSSVSRNGALLAYEETGGPTRGDIGVLPPGGGAADPAVHTAFDNEVRGMLSPDGRLLAYQSDEPGRWEIYLIRIADKHRTGVSTVVSSLRQVVIDWIAVGGTSNSEIAAAAGYKSEKTFYYAVHKFTGLTPAALRRLSADELETVRAACIPVATEVMALS